MTALFTLLPGAVAIISAETKLAILEALADSFAATYDLDRAAILAGLQERENLGSTGFGRGVAIPHARLGKLTRPVAAFLRLESPVDFQAADGVPVELVFGLLSSENAGATHLHALAAISRLMRDEQMRKALVNAPQADAIYGLISNVIDRDAA